MPSFAPTSYAKAVRTNLDPAVKKMLRIDSAKQAKTVQLHLNHRTKRWVSWASIPEIKISMVPIFLRFLRLDIERNPHRLQPVTTDLLARIKDLVGDEDIDINAPLLPEDDD